VKRDLTVVGYEQNCMDIMDISKNSKDIPDWYFVGINFWHANASHRHAEMKLWVPRLPQDPSDNAVFNDATQQSWCMSTNRSMMVTRVTMISVSVPKDESTMRRKSSSQFPIWQGIHKKHEV
jgi:hypothetical protein